MAGTTLTWPWACPEGCAGPWKESEAPLWKVPSAICLIAGPCQALPGSLQVTESSLGRAFEEVQVGLTCRGHGSAWKGLLWLWCPLVVTRLCDLVFGLRDTGKGYQCAG